MLYSKLFTKTSRDYPSDEVSRNAQLLIRAGFIHKTMAGVYSFLPLGLKVLRNIENIVRDEMNKIGGQEILMSSLSPKESWKITNRWEIPEYFKLPSQTNDDYRLNPTHEELISPIVASFVNSYKDLSDYSLENNTFPLSVYQIQTKFRDEIRAKAGIMRGREFRMKDMYDFHQTKESQDNFFERVTETYFKIFKQIGLNAYKVNASGGAFSEKFSREFQVECQAGEDWLYIDQSVSEVYNQEVAPCLANVIDYTNEIEKSKEDVYLESIIGVNNLLKSLNIEITRSTKTLFYIDTNEQFIVAVVRSDRNVSDEKLQKIHGKSLAFASEEFIFDKTGAKIGYAGIINLPKDAIVYYDDSLKYLKNFETGTNKTYYHSINVCFGRDLEYPAKLYDIKEAVEGDVNPNTGNKYIVKKGSEVGNIFDLGQKWVKAFNIKYADKNNVTQYPYMGCHGIGTSRCMGVIAEIYSDEKGLKWPKSVSPFEIHLITNLDKNDEIINQRILDLAQKFHTGRLRLLDNQTIANYDNQADKDKLSLSEWSRHIEVFWDDRLKNNLGEKLKDADLIGIPTQIIISKRSLENGGVEVIDRAGGETQIIKI